MQDFISLLDLNEDGSIDQGEFACWYDAMQKTLKKLNDANGANTVRGLTDAIKYAYESYYPLTDHPALKEAVESLRTLGGTRIRSTCTSCAGIPIAQHPYISNVGVPSSGKAVQPPPLRGQLHKALRDASQGLLSFAIDLKVCCATLTAALDSAGGDPRNDPLKLAKVRYLRCSFPHT